jgi:hypothetical protein
MTDTLFQWLDKLNGIKLSHDIGCEIKTVGIMGR